MTCDDTESALLEDGGALRPPVEAHLTGCPACRGFAQAHRAALRLSDGPPPRAARVRRGAIAGRVGVVGALLLLTTGALVLQAPPAVDSVPVTVVPAPAPAVEGSLPVAPAETSQPPAPSAEFHALWQLRDAVAFDARRDVAVVDAAYQAFGALPLWVAPTRTRPIRALGGAGHPIIYTSED